MKILDTYWFGGDAAIGIVTTENEMGERKFYIGIGDGHDAEADSAKIALYGMRVYQASINRIFERYGKK